MTTIDQTIHELLDRCDLPARVRDLRTGVDLSWSESDRAYLVPSGHWVVLSSTIRKGWGVLFTHAIPRREQGELNVI